MFAPAFAQVNAEVLIVMEAMPQASEEPLLIAATVVEAVPLAPNCTVMLRQIAFGATRSCTVTTAAQVLVLPLLSVTVRVTLFAPTFAQVKFELLIVKEAIPQASEEPLLIAAAVVEPVPFAFRETVTFWQIATGAMASVTVTVAAQVAVLPFTSVTVRVTGFAPTFEQLNEETLKAKEAIPQASEEPLFTAAAVVEPVPFASKETLTFLQSAIGATASTTVTVAEQVELFPFTSVTVKVTGFAPTFEQLNEVIFRLVEAMPQASEEPLFTAAAVVKPVPFAFRETVTFWQTATGATASTTVIVAEQVAVFAFTSVTVSVTVLAPTCVQLNEVWLSARL